MRFLLTGASSDIGKAIALGIFERGHEMVLMGSNEDSLGHLRDSFSLYKERCEFFLMNFQNYESAREDLEALLTKPLHGLILNGCTRLSRLKRFSDLPLEDSLNYIDLNLKANLWLLHRVLKHQVAQKFGRNLLISSVSSVMGTSRYGSYCLVKSGLEGLFRNLAVDYGAMNIFSNTLRPGIIESSRHVHVRERKNYQEGFLNKVPAGRAGRPEELAQAVALLLQELSYINGAHLEVSGGLPLFRSDFME